METVVVYTNIVDRSIGKLEKGGGTRGGNEERKGGGEEGREGGEGGEGGERRGVCEGLRERV